MKVRRFCVCMSIVLGMMSTESCVIYNTLIDEYKAAEERVIDMTNSSADNQYREFIQLRESSSISMGITIRDGKLTATDSLQQMGEIIDMIEYFLTEFFSSRPKAKTPESVQEPSQSDNTVSN